SRRRIVRQGAFVHEGSILFRASEQSAPEVILKLASIPLKGEHNVENVLAAVCAARLAGATPQAIRHGVENFRAVEHRLEFVAKVNDVDFYNDSKATNVDAAIKAIAAFPSGIHLILGGKDKNSDYSLLRPLVEARVKAVYTIGAAAEKIIAQIQGASPIVNAGTLEAAVAAAAEAAQPGDVVLLAPACSSFDQFENYEHRGQVFKDLVLARRGLGAWQSA
ncbi:MAG: cyanophycin synthetase, partial [Silvibacterium sp.]